MDTSDNHSGSGPSRQDQRQHEEQHHQQGPDPIPWFWRAITAVLVALAVACLLQVIVLPASVRVLGVVFFAVGALVTDIVARSLHVKSGPQRSFLQAVASVLPPLIIGMLMIRLSPMTGLPGVAIALGLGLLVFLVLTWGHRNHVRDAQRQAAPRGPEDLTRTAIAERGGDHHPRPDTPGSERRS